MSPLLSSTSAIAVYYHPEAASHFTVLDSVGTGILISHVLLLGELIGFVPSAHPTVPLIGMKASIRLLKPQVSMSMIIYLGCRWWGWLAGRGRHTLWCEPARSRRWAVEVRVFIHAHVSIISYRVHVYRVGRYSPQALSRDAWPWRACTQGLAGRGDGYPLNSYRRSSWETPGLSSVLWNWHVSCHEIIIHLLFNCAWA